MTETTSPITVFGVDQFVVGPFDLTAEMGLKRIDLGFDGSGELASVEAEYHGISAEAMQDLAAEAGDGVSVSVVMEDRLVCDAEEMAVTRLTVGGDVVGDTLLSGEVELMRCRDVEVEP